MSKDPALGLAQKLQLLAETATIDAACNPRTRLLARAAVVGLPRRAPRWHNALAAARWVRDFVRYAAERPETVSDVDALLETPVGDCDDMACLLAALLLCLGWSHDSLSWGVAWEHDRPVHVWLRAVGGDGTPGDPRRWIDLDPSTWDVDPGVSPMAVAPDLAWASYPFAQR